MGVVFIWMGIHGHYEHGLPILDFVITGYLPLTLWRHVTNRAVHCFRANAPLLYHRQVRMPCIDESCGLRHRPGAARDVHAMIQREVDRFAHDAVVDQHEHALWRVRRGSRSSAAT